MVINGGGGVSVKTVGPDWSSENAELSGHGAPAGESPRDVLYLGFGADLRALLDRAVPAARDAGARVAAIADLPFGVFPPAAEAGTVLADGFAPRVVLSLGDATARVTVGSRGTRTLWTTVTCTDGHSHAVLADLADWLESLPAVVPLPPWADAHLRELADAVAERHIGAPDDTVAPDAEARLLHNLHEPLLAQLPAGPVDELQLYAPRVDSDAEALRALVEHFAPGRVILAVPPPRVGYDADAVAAALAGRPAEIRIVDESDLHDGRLVQWWVGGEWTALTGGAELTRRALAATVADGGVAELAVLGPGDPRLMPQQGTRIPYEASSAAATATRPAANAPAAPVAPRPQPPAPHVPAPAPAAPPTAPVAASPAVPAPEAPQPAPTPAPVAEAPVPPPAAPAPSPYRDADLADDTPEFEGPYAEALAVLAASGWTADRQDGIWEVTGSFANPLPIAAAAVDGFAQVDPDGILFVRAASKGRWVFMAWNGRDLVVLKHDQPVWRTYRVDAPATPGSRFSGGSVAVPGLVGTSPQVKGAPPVLATMLGQLGWDYPELIKRLFA